MNIKQIAERPADFLGISNCPQEDEKDYQTFIEAVHSLVNEGWSEADAIEFVWNDGDFVGRASDVVAGWRP